MYLNNSVSVALMLVVADLIYLVFSRWVVTVLGETSVKVYIFSLGLIAIPQLWFWEKIKEAVEATRLFLAFRICPRDSAEVRWAKAYRNMDELVISLKEDFRIQQRERNRLDVLKDAFRKGCTSEAQMNEIREVSESLALVSRRIARQKKQYARKRKLLESTSFITGAEIPRY